MKCNSKGCLNLAVIHIKTIDIFLCEYHHKISGIKKNCLIYHDYEL